MPRLRMVPSPLEPCALAMLHVGPWNGLNPTGYKLVRRVPQTCKGLTLDQNETTGWINTGVPDQQNIGDLYP